MTIHPESPLARDLAELETYLSDSAPLAEALRHVAASCRIPIVERLLEAKKTIDPVCPKEVSRLYQARLESLISMEERPRVNSKKSRFSSTSPTPLPPKEKVLRIHVREKWFKQIRDGVKVLEYRLKTPYWFARLVSRDYTEIHILHGYPKRDETLKRLRFKWEGYAETEVESEEWNNQSGLDL